MTYTKEQTEYHFLYPQVGDGFSERCHYWVFIKQVDEECVVTFEGTGAMSTLYYHIDCWRNRAFRNPFTGEPVVRYEGHDPHEAQESYNLHGKRCVKCGRLIGSSLTYKDFPGVQLGQ